MHVPNIFANRSGSIPLSQLDDDFAAFQLGTGSSLVGFIASGAGAVARLSQSKMRETVSVQDFGAVGNGITDDTAKMQAAIDAVYTAGGGKVVVPAGSTFIVSAVSYAGIGTGVTSLVLKNNVTLQIDGVIKVKDNAYGPGALYGVIRSLDAGVSNAAIIGSGTVDGNVANQIAGIQASNIYLTCNENVVVKGINSINSNGLGIQLIPVSGSTWRYGAVQDCFVSNCSNIGIQVSHALFLAITGNRITTCANNGIDVYGEDGTSTADDGLIAISANTIGDTLSGIFVETTSRCAVTGNTISGSTIGIAVNRINGQPKLITVVGNVTADDCDTAFSATGDTGGVLVSENNFGFSSVGAQIGGIGGNVSYIDLHANFFLPSSTTADIIAIAGTVASFLFIKDNRYKDSSHNVANLIVNTAGTTTRCVVEPLISMTGPSFPVKEVWDGTSASGGTSTITVPAGWYAGKLVIKATAGGAWYSVWSGSFITDGSRVSVAQDSTAFTAPGNSIASVTGSGASRDITITWAASGSAGVWSAAAEYF